MDRGDLKVLIGCESSGVIRDAFFWAGFDAWSCDLLDADTPTNRHLKGDVREVMTWDEWDLIILAHPPCPRLCSTALRWISGRQGQDPISPVTGLPVPKKLPIGRTLPDLWNETQEAAQLFRDVMAGNAPMMCVENPKMHHVAKKLIWGGDFESLAKDDGTFKRTTVQPWHFATSEDSPDNTSKMTHLWLKGLPPLERTGSVDGVSIENGGTRRQDCFDATPSDDRWKERSKTYQGIADQMVSQWGPIAMQYKQTQMKQAA